MKLMSKPKNTLQNPNIDERAQELLRVIKWWVLRISMRISLDRFLKFFVAFELLASLMATKGRTRL